MSSDSDTPTLKKQGSKQDSTLQSIVNVGGSKQSMQVLNDRKVLLLYASGAAAAEGEVNESHMTVVKGRLEQRLKNISFLCDLEYNLHQNSYLYTQHFITYIEYNNISKYNLNINYFQHTIIKMDVQQPQFLSLEEEQFTKSWNQNKQLIQDKLLILIQLIIILFIQILIYSYIILQKFKDYENFKISNQINRIRHIAEIIKENYEKYSAFVILSGIATITYLGTNLSFMLENLQKTVVLTGSLIPLSFMRNDAFQNILDSLILAGNFLIPEVLIVMDHKAYRANRCRQLKCDSLDCIESPNFPNLVEFGINIEIKWQLVLLLKHIYNLLQEEVNKCSPMMKALQNQLLNL